MSSEPGTTLTRETKEKKKELIILILYEVLDVVVKRNFQYKKMYEGTKNVYFFHYS